MTDAIYSTADIYYKTGYEQGKADMLKKINDIKIEIKNNIEPNYNGHNEYDMSKGDGLQEALDIIDRHISGKDGE